MRRDILNPHARRLGGRLLPLVAPLLAVVLLAGTAAAEPYLGFYLSGIPASEHQVKADRTFAGTGVTDRFTTNDVRFGSSVAFGGVVGYRFLPFLAVEIDSFHLSPGIESQTRTANSPTVGSVPVSIAAGDLDVTGVALGPVGSYSLLPDQNVREGRLQLYAGAGLGVFFSSVDVRFNSPFANLSVRDSDTSVGPHVKAGARWFFTRNIAAFVEFRYSRFSLDVEGDGVTGAGAPVRIKLTGDADAPVGLVGVSWHFR